MDRTPEETTIMVVDDTPANLKLLQDILQTSGYRVLAFTKGRMALTAAVKHPPDLFLLDISMPEMNGFELCKRLKAHGMLKDIPVLFISALTETSDKVKAFAVGGVDYVTKPFQFEEVHARIRTHVELYRQRRQLQEAYNKLHELTALRDNLTHMIVHDMRSPLTAVLGSLELLHAHIPQDKAETYELWQVGKNAAHHLVEMCNSLLDVSRLESGQMPIQREPCELSDAVSNAISATRTHANDASVTVVAETEPVRISADKGLLHRVLTNLLTNAIKHSPRNGQVTIRTCASADSVRIEVADAGPGIPSEYHARVFEKFAQLDARQEGQKHSAGLGLTFCKLAVEVHGGQIGVDSEVGRGCAFWLNLPGTLNA